MELNDHENYALSAFTTLINNNICKEKLMEYIVATEDDLGNHDVINWLKIAIELNSKKMVDAVFGVKDITENHVAEAIMFGLIKEYEKASNNFHITLELPDNFNILNTLDYIQEKDKFLVCY